MNYTPSFNQIAGFGYGTGYGTSAPTAPAMSMPGTAPAAPTIDFNTIAGFGSGAAGAAGAGFNPVDPSAAGGAMGMPAQQGMMGKIGGWLGNSQNLATVFQGISALTGAYLGFQQLRLAKENMALQKEAYRTNIQNSTQSYNTSLEDRIRGRTAAYAGKEQDVQSYLAANRLSDKPKKG